MSYEPSVAPISFDSRDSYVLEVSGKCILELQHGFITNPDNKIFFRREIAPGLPDTTKANAQGYLTEGGCEAFYLDSNRVTYIYLRSCNASGNPVPGGVDDYVYLLPT